MSETNQNVWAPWRMEYIEQLDGTPEQGGCFLCHYRDTPGDDRRNHVLRRSARTMTLLNRFPYTNGHLLVAPLDHCEKPEDLSEEVLFEMTLHIRDAIRVLRKIVGAQGFNVGMNLGRCAGAGLPGHVHWHIVPRWEGDTNFMAVTGGVRVIPQALDAVDDGFRAAAAELGIS